MLEGYIFTVIGLICFVEGLPYLATPEHVKKWLTWLLSASNPALRLLGGALMVVGLLLVTDYFSTLSRLAYSLTPDWLFGIERSLLK